MRECECPVCGSYYAPAGILGHVRLAHGKSASEARRLLRGESSNPDRPKRKRKARPKAEISEAEEDPNGDLPLTWILGIAALILLGPGVLKSLGMSTRPPRLP